MFVCTLKFAEEGFIQEQRKECGGRRNGLSRGRSRLEKEEEGAEGENRWNKSKTGVFYGEQIYCAACISFLQS